MSEEYSLKASRVYADSRALSAERYVHIYVGRNRSAHIFKTAPLSSDLGTRCVEKFFIPGEALRQLDLERAERATFRHQR